MYSIEKLREAAAIQMLADYYRDFSSLDLARIAPHFHEPCLITSSAGDVIGAENHAAVAAALRPVMEGLRARGYGRSELTLKHQGWLGHDDVFATGVAIRYYRDGLEMERAGVTYVLHSSATAWKIAVLVTHHADSPVGVSVTSAPHA